MPIKPKNIRQRADERAVACGLASNLVEARKFLLAGVLRSPEGHLIKAGTLLSAHNDLVLHDPYWRDIGRGATKIRPILEQYAEQVAGCIALDAGAATGGFTQVLLDLGAAQVWAMDVGQGLLVPVLADDARVVVCDRSNFRNGPPEEAAGKVGVLVADLSFISLTVMIESISASLCDRAIALLLVKPQFELPRDRVPAGGVVTSQSDRQWAIDSVLSKYEASGYQKLAVYPAAQTGRRGNQEYFLCLQYR